MKSRRSDRRVVYSTDPEPDPPCPTCGRSPCTCPPESPPPGRQVARIALDRKRRRGKVVTTVSGLQLAPAELAALGKALRRECGAGGTVKSGTIEVQGDHRERVAQILRERGYTVKFVGG